MPLSGLLFTALYMYMPNTDIRFGMPSFRFTAGNVCSSSFQYFYIHSQIWVSSYYLRVVRSLAHVHVVGQFLMDYLSFGAQLSYANNQNLRSYYYIKDIHKIRLHTNDVLPILTASKVCKRFEKKGMEGYP